jgi:hypothetical protein
MGVGSTTLLAIAAAVIVGVVLYGLNSTWFGYGARWRPGAKPQYSKAGSIGTR